MIKNSKPNAEAEDYENEDEFDSYMEERLMADADSLGILDPSRQEANADVY